MKAKFNPLLRASRGSRALSRNVTLGVGLIVAAIISQSAHAADWTNALANQDFNAVGNWSVDPNGENLLINLAAPGSQPVLGVNQTIGPIDIILGSGGGTGRFDHTGGAAGTGNFNWMFVGGTNSTGTYNLADTTGTGGTLTGFAQGTGSMDVGGFSQSGRLIVGDGGTSNGTVNVNTSGVLTAKEGLGLLVATNGGDGTINLDGGTIETTQAWFGDNNADSTGTLNMSGGTINTTADVIFGRVTGVGIGTISGGVLNVGGALFLAEGTGPANAASGTLTVQTGGTVNSIGDVRVSSSGNNSGTLNISGGTLNLGPTGERWMIVGAYDSGSATVNVSSGNLNLLNNTDLRFNTQFNNTGTHVINQTGGAVTFYTDNGTTTVGSSGVLDMQRDGNTSSSSTYHLSGGTLTVSQIVTDEILAERGTRTFNFNGGTLKPTGSTANFMDAGVVTRANVRNGGAVIDTNGFDVTIGHALEHSDIGGDSSTDGGLTKQGAGVLTLTGANTYTGNTTVSAGTLSLASAFLADGSTVTIGNSAFLNLNYTGTDVVAGLTLGVDVKAPGVYGATGSGAQFETARITGNGRIQVVSSISYATWAATNAGGQASNLDFDNDGVENGVEYFMGATGSSFTANPGIVDGKVVWPKDPAFSGTYTVQTSPDLVIWTNVSSTVVGNTVEYTVPAGQGKFFIRLHVLPN